MRHDGRIFEMILGRESAQEAERVIAEAVQDVGRIVGSGQCCKHDVEQRLAGDYEGQVACTLLRDIQMMEQSAADVAECDWRRSSEALRVDAECG